MHLNPLKKLVGQTAIYGLPSVLGRFLNYLLVPLYTRVLPDSEYGTVSVLYAYVGFLLVMLTYGMETSFFRYTQTTGNREKTYKTALYSVLFTALLFIAITQFYAGSIASLIDYPDYPNYVRWFGLIIAFDAISSIPLAYLRSCNKAKRFSSVKMINIGVNISLNLFFILLCPYLATHGPSVMQPFFGYFQREDLIAWIFISNLIASALTLLLLAPDMVKRQVSFDMRLLKKMLRYGFPLMLAGLAGIANETLDRLLLRYILPSDIAEAQVGIYSACYKISILMTIFIQAYRYSAEPFFFSYANKKDSKTVYAAMMNMFVIAVSFLFLLTMLFLDVVLLFIEESYRVGKPVIPILLVANLALGIYYNLSVWYKLTNKTRYGAFLSIVGAAITLSLNIWLIPIMGYMGSAWATLACYISMMVISYLLGKRYYPINYGVVKISIYLGVALLFGLGITYLHFDTTIYYYAARFLLLLLYGAMILFMERKMILEFLASKRRG